MKRTSAIPILAKLATFLRDERGSLTAEFVLWVPVLGFWFALSVGVFDAYKSRNAAAKTANTIADIITREDTVDNAFLDNLLLLEQRLLPRAPSGEQLRISSIQYTAANGYTVRWSRAMGGGQQSLTDADIPLGIMPTMAELDTIILTEVDIPWDPFDFVSVVDPQPWSFEIVARPRFVTEILYN